jgi:hypothetical protein
MSDGDELIHYQIQRKDFLAGKDQSPMDQFPLALARANSSVGTNANSRFTQTLSTISTNANRTNVISSNTAPTLGITLRDGFVLINSLPPITNVVLEEANSASYPLIWQPATVSSNTPDGWQLPATVGVKLFRLHLIGAPQ